jgi:Ser/Thr protein kinase RdoA (MazF antagonist)
VRSVLSDGEVARLVAEGYDLPGPVECRLALANDNDNYYVCSGPERARSVFRVYRHAKHWLPDEASHRFELDWLRYAHGRGAPVSPPLPRRDGALLGSAEAPEGRRYTALFAFAEGTHPPLTPDGARALGAAIARLHDASVGFASPHGRLTTDAEFTLHGPAARVERFLAGSGQERPEDLRLLGEAVARAAPAFERVPRDAATWGVIGGDCHAGNQLVAPDGRVTLIDFDICGWSFYAYDCATLRWSIHGRPGAETPELWAAYLEGYGAVRALTVEERAAIPWFALARQVWLLGAHTVYSVHRGQAWLGPAYWDWQFKALREYLEDAEKAV